MTPPGFRNEPILELRRAAVLQAYASEIEALYAG